MPDAAQVFIADLHLDPNNTASYRLALAFFDACKGVESLYILGDLFEYWVGDDAGIPLYDEIITSLAELRNTGCKLTVMHGNRDFLLGDAFAESTGASLVRSDELLIHWQDQRVLLLHGDTLCTDDHAYQSFRSQVRDKAWQSTFLAQSIDERLHFAAQIRKQSRKLSAEKQDDLMDVNLQQVEKRLRAHRCRHMIHGHTHRPAHHSGGGAQRFVVGDWHASHAQYVLMHNTRLSLETWHACSNT